MKKCCRFSRGYSKKNVSFQRHISYLFTHLNFAFSPAPVAPHVFSKLTRLVQTPAFRISIPLHVPRCLFRLRDTASRFRVHSLRPRAILLCIPASVTGEGYSLGHTRRKSGSVFSTCQNPCVSQIGQVRPCRCCHLSFSRLLSFCILDVFPYHCIQLLAKKTFQFFLHTMEN